MKKIFLQGRVNLFIDSVLGRSFGKRVILADTAESIAYNHNIAHGAYFYALPHPIKEKYVTAFYVLPLFL